MVKLYDERYTDTHESYGIARFSRISGGGQNFFGTIIKPQHYIDFEVFHARKEICNISGDERFYEENRGKPIISIKMTSSQFAELITTMNVGSGIPVTIKRIDGVRVGECPDQESPMKITIDKAKEGVAETEAELSVDIDEIIAEISNNKLGQKKTEGLIKKLERVRERLASNASFYQEMMIETGEKQMALIKSEVDNTVTSIVNRLGLKSLDKLKEIEQTLDIKTEE